MSSQADNVHTINLGKVLLSQRQHRAVRAINMIREYTLRHRGAVNVKIDEKLAQRIWARGVRRPPRKITVEFVEDDDVVLVTPYESIDVAEPGGTAEPDTAKMGGSGTEAGAVTAAAALAEPETKEDVAEEAAVQKPDGQDEASVVPEEFKTEVVEIGSAPEELKGEEADDNEAEEAAVQKPDGQDEVSAEADAVKPDDDSPADTTATATKEPPEAEPSEAAESKSTDPEEPHKE